MSGLQLISRSTDPVVTLEEAVQHLRRDDTERDDDLILRYIAAATQFVENFTGIALSEQIWDYYLDSFPTNNLVGIAIPRPPLLDVQQISFRDSSSGLDTAFTGFFADLASRPGRVFVVSTGSWPVADASLNSVRIRFRAGYIDSLGSPPSADDIPDAIKAAILMYTASLYENREAGTQGEWIKDLLRPYRVETSVG